MHNSELCDNLGNLVNRAVKLCGGTVPAGDVSLVQPPFDMQDLKNQVSVAFAAHKINDVASLAIHVCSQTNKWIANLAPWKMKGEDQAATRSACLRVLIEAIYVLAHLFAPFCPIAAEAIFAKVGAAPRPIPILADDFSNLVTGSPVVSESILFEVLEVPEE